MDHSANEYFFDTDSLTPYHCKLMYISSDLIPLPRYINPHKFAQQSIKITGTIALNDLSRLNDLLFSQEGHIRVILIFSITEENITNMVGELNANIENICQRCLGSLPSSVYCDLNLAILRKKEARHLPKYFDSWIVSEEQTDVYQILEDELLLSLPIASYHDNECVPRSYFSSGEEGAEIAIQESSAANPFQVLKFLKKPLKSVDG